MHKSICMFIYIYVHLYEEKQKWQGKRLLVGRNREMVLKEGNRKIWTWSMWYTWWNLYVKPSTIYNEHMPIKSDWFILNYLIYLIAFCGSLKLWILIEIMYNQKRYVYWISKRKSLTSIVELFFSLKWTIQFHKEKNSVSLSSQSTFFKKNVQK